MSAVTQILQSIEQGDPRAANELLPLVYEELRRLAAQKLAQEKPGQTLEATALVHEAYLRLVDVEKAQHWNSRGHFFAAAAEAMRRILVESARRKQSQKHGGQRRRVALDQAEAMAAALPEDLLALDEALERLNQHAWKRLCFREGTKGTQQAHFARVRIVAERDDLPGPDLWLVIERSCDQAPYTKYYLSNAAPNCPLLERVQAGHNRWPVEDCFLRGKQEVGLDDYEVRGWRGWHHHMTLAMLALWFLVLQKRRLGKKTQTGMTLPDVRRLLQVIFAPELPTQPERHVINLSEWRQQRNGIASDCHARARKERLRNTG